METNQTWLTINEACDYLRCSKPTLYRYLKDRTITTAKLANKRLVNKASLDKALAQ
jgi:excisionase family DNA binding protein